MAEIVGDWDLDFFCFLKVHCPEQIVNGVRLLDIANFE